MTKEERKVYMKKYRQEHREQINANRRYWAAQNIERYREYNRRNAHAYYEKHKDDPEFKAKLKEASKKWVEKNRERNRAYQRERYRQKAIEQREVARNG